ncbi:MAG: MFS transporter [SAR202 cluster bacterium]|jgi:EmrB/QacA subfamily drug resistance transporter|nr:MFS transporter [Chloroflexota bacterium]MDP6421625.1 MDR family MFS transporter [SAR202 cluster bacterium]MQG57329.1 MFS transporter [SAR202 cluster bacterium]MQG67534.1 MFS transporter [SAR202 cluster bacterium]|tara:strand:- start:360 stop:2042 length:1683 start_codon:yes stop_codon:yes gene_type:complete
MEIPSQHAGAGSKQASAPRQDNFIQLSRRTVVLTMAGVMLAMFLASLDQTVVGTAMPRIIADLGGFDSFTWVTTAYLVASTTVVPIVGRLTDMYGRKMFYIAGILVFVTGSVAAGLSGTMNQLILSRALQGVGGGVIMAISFVSIADLFPPEDRGKFQGLMAGVFGLSSVLGPTLGGFITDNLSWNWVFLVNVPIAIPIVGLFIKFFPDTRRPGSETDRQLEYLGMAALVLGVVPLLLGLSWGGVQYEWVSVQVIGALGFGLAMSIVFVMVESRTAAPIMPLDIYKNRMVTVSLIAIFLTGFGMFGAIIFIPLFFQGVLGASATSSGSFLTPMMMGVVFGAGLSGQILSRTGGHYRIQALIGIAIMTTGMYLIGNMDETTRFGTAVGYLIVMGFGLGTTFPVFTLAVQNSVTFSVMGIATSATQFYRSIGGMLGLAVLGAVMANRFASRLAETMTDTLSQALPPGQFESLQENPQALVNPEALVALRGSLEQTGPEGAAKADQLVALMKSALAGAIGDVFTISVVVVASAFVVTLFLRQSKVQSEATSRLSEAPGVADGD